MLQKTDHAARDRDRVVRSITEVSGAGPWMNQAVSYPAWVLGRILVLLGSLDRRQAEILLRRAAVLHGHRSSSAPASGELWDKL
jgi:hypothetical protein